MRRILILLLVSSYSCFAGFNTYLQVEVRPTGSDSNGGGFIQGATGTDYSQQDAAHCTASDLTLVTTTTATSAACPFGANSVGNLIQITAGTNCTTGFYEVRSVAVVTATLDRVAGTTGCTAGTFALGGGLLTPALAMSGILAQAPTYCTVWIKNGTYTVTSSLAWGNWSLVGNVWYGYTTTHGDVGTRPLITTATNSVVLMTFDSVGSIDGVTFRNMRFSHTAGTRGIGFRAPIFAFMRNLTFRECLLDGFSTAIYANVGNGYYGWNALLVINSEVKNSTVNGIVNAGLTTAYAYYGHDNAGAAVAGDVTTNLSGGQISVDRSILVANAYGVNANQFGNGQAVRVTNSVIKGNTADGVLITGGIYYPVLINNIFYGNTGYGVDCTAGCSASVNVRAWFLQYNAFRSNGSGTYQGFPTSAFQNDITLSADPFTNAAGEDYSLNATVGGGALLRSSGFPQVYFAPSATASTPAVGSAQGSAGGGSGTCSCVIGGN